MMSVSPSRGEHLLPQVVGLEAVGVRRVARPVVPSLVEGQEPRCLALEARAEPHFVVVNGEVGQAAAKLEELLSGVAIALVLLDGVAHCLLGQAVLQLERGDGQAVDKQAQVQGELGLVQAVAELPRNAEAILPIQDLSPFVSRRRRAVHQVDLVRPVLDAIAKHVDCAPPGNLPLQAGKEPAAGGAVLPEIQRLCGTGLGVP